MNREELLKIAKPMLLNTDYVEGLEEKVNSLEKTLSGIKQKRRAKYKFLGEIELCMDGEEPSSICIIKCARCGWIMFGDGYWESEHGNCSSAEQIPRYCAHCGAEFTDEAQEKGDTE